ncbi:MAG TPA: type II secretion system protein [Bacilli bacterium]|nr:type II secretion system protein [Bacilli bacterium]
MKEKGFTLVEILAVIVVLGVVCLVAVPSVNSIISKSKEKAKVVQIKQIVESAKKWASNNYNMLTDDKPYYITVEELMNANYIDSSNVVDPTDKEKEMDQCVRITYINEYDNYDFKYVDC